MLVFVLGHAPSEAAQLDANAASDELRS